MIIDNIEIQNFKSIKHAQINNCKRINLFVGPPNIGKSNLLEAIGICGLNWNDTGKNFTDFVRFDGFYDLVFQGSENNHIGITINNKHIVLKHIFNEDNTPQNFKITKYQTENGLVAELDLTVREKIIRTSGNISFENTDNIRYYKFKENLNFANATSLVLDTPCGKNFGTTIIGYPKLLELIQNYFNPTKESFILSIDKDGTRVPKISSSIGEHLKIERSYNLVADTLKRIIFYLTAVYSNKNASLLFEEPEAHCYEPYILDFTNAIKFDEKNNQYFIVTHSDYIVQEFLRESEYRDQTNIYTVNNIGNGTEVKLLDPEKNIDVYQFGTNVFFNFESIWNENNG